jgi:hypothetical protein
MKTVVPLMKHSKVTEPLPSRFLLAAAQSNLFSPFHLRLVETAILAALLAGDCTPVTNLLK